MNAVLGLFERYEDAEQAVERLDASSFKPRAISVITQKGVMQRYLARFDQLESETGPGAIRGAALDGLTGLLVGLGAQVVPGIGSLLMTGPIATAVLNATGDLAGPLTEIGVPRRLARLYREGIERDQILLAVQTTRRRKNALGLFQKAGGKHIFALRSNRAARSSDRRLRSTE